MQVLVLVSEITVITGQVPGFQICSDSWVNQEFKALITGLPKNLLVQPGILGKNQLLNQEDPGQGGTFQ